MLDALELDYSKFPDHCDCVILAMTTGMRSESEIFSFKKAQVNWVTSQITLEETKSGKREIVRLNETALNVIKRAFNRNKKGDHVFFNTKGRRLKRLGRWWYKLLKRVGIEDFRFHDLRHCFASYLSMSGANQFDLKEAMRHKSLSMTNRYVHLMPSHQDGVIKRLDGFLDNYIDNQDSNSRKVVALKR